MNLQTPKLYSLFKIHKINHPIRPVVSFTTAPSYKLSKCLINIIVFNTKFKSKFGIKNSLELINNINDMHIPNNAILLSLDVKKKIYFPECHHLKHLLINF